MTARRCLLDAATILLLSACGPGAAGNGQSPTTTISDDSSSESASDESTEETTTDTESETGACEPEPSENLDAYYWPTCNMIVQDCPEGEKCVPYASDDQTWDHFKCVPVAGEGEPGEPCTTTGLLGAQDDCNATSFCAGYDENNAGGTCHPFCTGGLEMPECMDGWGCAVPDVDWFLCEIPAYCVQPCDPLADSCEPGSVCARIGSVFTCVGEGSRG